MGSLEVMVKSMLDLRQLETFAPKKLPSCPPPDRERGSTSSLQEPPVGLESGVQQREKYEFCLSPALPLLQQLFEDRAQRHRRWLSSHASRGIKGSEGAGLYPEEDEDERGPQHRWVTAGDDDDPEGEQCHCNPSFNLSSPVSPPCHTSVITW